MKYPGRILSGSRPNISTTGASGIWLPQDQMQGTFAEKWPGSLVSVDPYFSNVELLLHFDGSNGSTTFTDSSSRATAVTAVNSSLITSNYKFGTASGDFSAVTKYATLSNSNFNFGTGDFTIEFWLYYISANAVAFGAFFDNGAQGTYLSYGSSGSNILFYSAVAQGNNTGAAHGMTNNTWNHLAFVRTGTTLYSFVNGVIKETYTSITGSFSPASGATAYIGAYSGSPGSTYYAGGYIDDFRITKGVARYTSNFTPPTAAFPNG